MNFSIFRKRKSPSNSPKDEDVEEKEAKKAKTGKDFKIPKKKSPTTTTPGSTSTTGSNPLGSPLKTEKKFEQV